MEMLILAAIAAFVVKNAAVDTVAMATGKTPPSHAYRMARLKEQAASERRRLAADPDNRGGLKMVARHWYLDACEDVDHWRAHRHQTKPERKAARQRRRAERARVIREWAERHVPDVGDEDADGIVDAEIIDETDEFTPPGTEEPRPRPERRRWRRTTTEEVYEEEADRPAPGSDVVLLNPDEQTEKAPLPHRRLVLMTMLASAGYAPDTEAIGRMTSEEVDGAIAALIAHERATRTASH
ncbi:hypothetical protein [Nocardiopsis sp. NRRL B-16309]|uniref:hypothetical protein n=1 Tax=Nocardiopsis sp. NRRL B-16309 TaxID=1519494 RepID=UPI0006B04508|nr:hypothetical protein [Nocardiopsis sp. NRRL B-16309]KOX18058.1 hypothetical protein ADL05_08065 [Nocardiopsis sp. NRRL B-16309]